uniref:Putative secreted protein n=1 Tax=Phlebotomus kandelakii TaxID=1109342 RepID=A0A6B2EA37_9DIPT
MKCLVGVVVSVALVALIVIPRVSCQDDLDAELAVARANCEVTYVCCRLHVKRRRFQFLRKLSWRRRTRCVRWCPQQNTCPEIPTPFEAFDVDTAAEDDNPNEFLHGASDDNPNADVDEAAEADVEVTEEEATQQESEDPDDEDVVDIPVEGPIPLGISTASVIKVPCNGNFRPDRYGVCRPVF